MKIYDVKDQVKSETGQTRLGIKDGPYSLLIVISELDFYFYF
jgi:hypothetical protein